MTTAIQQSSTAATSLYSRDQIDTIKRTVAKGSSDHDLALFLEVCRARGLDPFTRQVHWTPKGIICGIDGFRAIADRTGRYVPGPTQYEMAGDKLVAAHVTVKKNVGGTWFDVTESAYMSEYSASTPIWREKPRVMLAKCAEARCLRRAFPAEISGLYSPEEMNEEPAPAAPPMRSIPTPPVRQVQVTSAPAIEVKVEPAHDVVTGEVVSDDEIPAVSFRAAQLVTQANAAASSTDLDVVAKATNAAMRAQEIDAADLAVIKAAVQSKRAALAGT